MGPSSMEQTGQTGTLFGFLNTLLYEAPPIRHA